MAKNRSQVVFRSRGQAAPRTKGYDYIWSHNLCHGPFSSGGNVGANFFLIGVDYKSDICD